MQICARSVLTGTQVKEWSGRHLLCSLLVPGLMIDKPGQAKTQKNKVIAVAGMAFPGASVENWALDGWAAW